MRVSRDRSFVIKASLTPRDAEEYRPNSYGRATSPTRDVAAFRLSSLGALFLL
jgi:hypothetical protein